MKKISKKLKTTTKNVRFSDLVAILWVAFQLIILSPLLYRPDRFGEITLINFIFSILFYFVTDKTKRGLHIYFLSFVCISTLLVFYLIGIDADLSKVAVLFYILLIGSVLLIIKDHASKGIFIFSCATILLAVILQIFSLQDFNFANGVEQIGRLFNPSDVIGSMQIRNSFSLCFLFIILCTLIKTLDTQESLHLFTNKISSISLLNIFAKGPLDAERKYFLKEYKATKYHSKINDIKLLSQVFPPFIGALVFLTYDYSSFSYYASATGLMLPAVITFLLLGFYYFACVDGAEPKLSTKKIITIIPSVLVLVVILGFFSLGTSEMGTGRSGDPQNAVFVCIGITASLLVFESYILRQSRKRRSLFLQNLVLFCNGLIISIPIMLLSYLSFIEQEQIELNLNLTIIFSLLAIMSRKPLLALFSNQRQNFTTLFLGSFVEIRDAFTSSVRKVFPYFVHIFIALVIINLISVSSLSEIVSGIFEFISFDNFYLAIPLATIIAFLLSSFVGGVIAFPVISYVIVPPLINIANMAGISFSITAAYIIILIASAIGNSYAPIPGVISIRKRGKGSYKISLQLDNEKLDKIAILLFIPIVLSINQNLITQNIFDHNKLISVFVVVTFSLFCWASVITGKFFGRKLGFGSLILLGVLCLSLAKPQVLINRLYPPFEYHPPSKFKQIAEETPVGNQMLLVTKGMDELGRSRVMEYVFENPEGTSGVQKLYNYGITLERNDGQYTIAGIEYGSAAESDGVVPGFMIDKIGVRVKQPNTNWVIIPAITFYIMLFIYNLRRKFTS